MRICASRRETGLLRQTIVATRRKRSQPRARQASPDPGPLQGSLFHAPRSGCQTGPLSRTGRHPTLLVAVTPPTRWVRHHQRWRPTPSNVVRPTVGRYPKVVRPEGRTGFLIPRPRLIRLRSIPLPPGQPAPLQPPPACRTASAFPTRSARRRCDDGWRGRPGRYRPGSGGRR